jgi:hypothetical protein
LPNPTDRIINVQSSILFLEPIPIGSFVRHKLLRLFIKSGMDDFQSQILLSIILHGGQIKPKTLAKDIDCNPSRLELPDGFPSLVNLDLIITSHTRPKTAILAIAIDELLERLATRTLIPNNYIKTKDAIDILLKLDKYEFIDESSSSGKFDDFLYILNYFNHLKKLSTKLPALLSLLFFILSSLWMNPSEAIVLTKLIIMGGKMSKKEFFETHMQNISLENLQENSRQIKETLEILGYPLGQVEDLILKINAFYSNNITAFKFSSEQQLNMTLNNLQEFCQSTSMGEKAGKRKFRNLTLIKSISQIADSLNLSNINFQKQIRLDLQILKLAYSNVRLVDGDIYLSTISDPSSTRKRIETDVKYVTTINLSILHTYFVEDLFLKIFDSDNINFKLNIIASLEAKELFINMLLKHKLGIQNKRGILEGDTITFVPPDEIPQDVLIGNTIILLYKNNSSMIIIHEEITKENPTEINAISGDVQFAYKSFNEIMKKYIKDTESIKHLVSEGGN